MTAKEDIYETARQNRDPRFDGRFFVGVLSTGIYCRPVCPVPVPRRENVRLYPSAAAAAEAGFRPCLRCRPEASPGTPAWLGSSHTVSRALRLIAPQVTAGGSIDDLARELNISTRQLNRLFNKHLGASPKAVMQTRRLHFAKQLLDETTLPMSEICFAAGFGSIRRFNEVIKQTYGATPSQIRQRRRLKIRERPYIEISLSYRPPFDWQAMLAFFAARAIPGIEQVRQSTYVRTINLAGSIGTIEVDFSPPGNRLKLSIDYPDSSRLLEIVERVRNLFDLQADSTLVDARLGADPRLAGAVANNPGLRVPGCWDGLEISVRAVVGQQVSVKAAATLMRRLVERTGMSYNRSVKQGDDSLCRVFPPASQLAQSDLSGLGITGQRIEAINTIAGQVARGELSFDGSQSTEQFCSRICAIKGVGEWTAQYIALRVLHDPDAFPHGDLILRRALEPGRTLSARQLQQAAESWRPWRAYAVMQLWRNYQQQAISDQQREAAVR